MPLDDRDPHYALGIDHGRIGADPYPFQDAENMRRYIIGYEVGAVQRRMLYTDQQPTNFQRFAQSLQQQQPRRITATDLQRYWRQS